MKTKITMAAMAFLASSTVVAGESAKLPTSTCNIQTANAPFTWTNELGSSATFMVADNGNIGGHYVNGAPSSCTPEGAQYYLTGFCNGNAITFTVNWGNQCNSLTSWSGIY